MCQGAQTLAKEFSLFIFAHGDNGLVTISCRGTALDRRSSAPAAFQQWSTEIRTIYLLVKRKLSLTFLPVPVHDTWYISTDLYHWLKDLYLAPDHCFICQWMIRCQQKIIFLHCSASYFLKVNLLKISKRKSQKQVQFSINQGFSYFFVCRWKDPDLFKYWQIRIWKAQKRTDPEAPHSLAVTVLIILISWKIKFKLLLRQLGGTTFLYLQVAKVGYHT